MYRTVLVADFSVLGQYVGEAVTAVDSSTNTIMYMNEKTTHAFPYIGHEGANTVLDMRRGGASTLSYMRRRAANALSYMPASAVPPTQFRTCANGMRHHAG